MKNKKSLEEFAEFAFSKSSLKALHTIKGGRCPESLAGDPNKCNKYWGDDQAGAQACINSCSHTYK